MAEIHFQPDKMAVNSIDHNPTNTNDIQQVLDESVSITKGNTQVTFVQGQDLSLNIRKKSGFQITRVVTKSGGSDHADGDVDDDLDETNTEEVSSEMLDVSKTDTDVDPPSEDTISAQSIPASNEDFQKDSSLLHIPSSSSATTTLQHSTLTNHIDFQPVTHLAGGMVESFVCAVAAQPDEPQLDVVSDVVSQTLPDPNKEKAAESRFKVVKIESKEPFRRGRWTCLDFLNSRPSERSEKPEKSGEEVGSHGSGNSSAASSVHYVPGVDDPSRNPLLEGSANSVISPNGEYNTQSQTYNGSGKGFTNGSHIMTNASMPSQHIPAQVPTTLTQTHTNSTSGVESVSNQFISNQQQASGNGHVPHSQNAQSQSFSQGNLPSQVSTQPVMQQSSSIANDKEFVSQQTDYIPGSAIPNAQPPKDTPSKQSGNLTSESSVQKSDFAQGITNTKTSSPGTDNVQTSDFVQEVGYSSSRVAEGNSQATGSNDQKPEMSRLLLGQPSLLEMVMPGIKTDSEEG